MPINAKQIKLLIIKLWKYNHLNLGRSLKPHTSWLWARPCWMLVTQQTNQLISKSNELHTPFHSIADLSVHWIRRFRNLFAPFRSSASNFAVHVQPFHEGHCYVKSNLCCKYNCLVKTSQLIWFILDKRMTYKISYMNEYHGRWRHQTPENVFRVRSKSHIICFAILF